MENTEEPIKILIVGDDSGTLRKHLDVITNRYRLESSRDVIVVDVVRPEHLVDYPSMLTSQRLIDGEAVEYQIRLQGLMDRVRAHIWDSEAKDKQLVKQMFPDIHFSRPGYRHGTLPRGERIPHRQRADKRKHPH